MRSLRFVPVATLIAPLPLLGVLAITSPASAMDPKDRFGAKGEAIFSADRVMPLLSYTSTDVVTKTVNGNLTFQNDVTTNRTTSALLWTGASTTVDEVPRLSFDYTIIDHLTLGGSAFVFFTLGANDTRTQGNFSQTVDAGKVTIFGIAPRVGYILNIADTFAFWPRGGLTLAHTDQTILITNNNNTTTDTSGFTEFSLNLEPMFVFHPVEHFGFVFGPLADIPIAGPGTVTNNAGGIIVSNDQAVKTLHLGITAGILGWL